MPTQNTPNDINRLIAEYRQVQRLTTREFAKALEVSQNAVYQWEKGIAEPTLDRLITWMKDERPWVKALGLKIYTLKYTPALAAAANAAPIA